VAEKSQFFWGPKKKGKKLWLKNPNSFLGGKRRRKLSGDGLIKNLILLGGKREEIMVEKSQFFFGSKRRRKLLGDG
jgi:hypothetical protein